jgi:hypothetical protein
MNEKRRTETIFISKMPIFYLPIGTVYTRQKPDYFPRFFLGWFPSCVNFQKVEFGHEQELFPDDGSCDENFEMILTGMESHGTRYDQNIRNKFENDLLIAKCG